MWIKLCTSPILSQLKLYQQIASAKQFWIHLVIWKKKHASSGSLRLEEEQKTLEL